MRTSYFSENVGYENVQLENENHFFFILINFQTRNNIHIYYIEFRNYDKIT